MFEICQGVNERTKVENPWFRWPWSNATSIDLAGYGSGHATFTEWSVFVFCFYQQWQRKILLIVYFCVLRGRHFCLMTPVIQPTIQL